MVVVLSIVALKTPLLLGVKLVTIVVVYVNLL